MRREKSICVSLSRIIGQSESVTRHNLPLKKNQNQNTMKRLVFFLFCSMMALASFAQNRVTGVVTDATGEPLIGVNVVEDGTTNGTVTDIDGQYSINIGDGHTLTFRFVGYSSQTINPAGKSVVNVTMTEDSEILQDVIVMAYGGKSNRAKVTNSIAKVDDKALSSGIHSNPAQALSGAVAGLRVQQTSGDPGATPSLTLRGGTSLNGTGSPLVIIDGAERSMADINPQDIETMQVMKDAGSTAIYGARAANGVILINTKRGKEGHSSINVRAKYGLNYYRDNYNYLNAEDYLYYMRTAYYRGSHVAKLSNGSWMGPANYSTVNGTQPYGTGNIYRNADGTIADGNKVNAANWSTMKYDASNPDHQALLKKGWQVMNDPLATLDPENFAGQQLIFYDFQLRDYNINSPAASQDYMVDMSGGNDKGSYYASLGFNNSEGTATKNWYRRFTFTFNGDYKIRKWLTSSSSFNFSNNTWYGMTPTQCAANYFSRTMTVPPTFRGRNEDGEWLIGVRGTGDANVLAYIDAYKQDNNTSKFTMGQSFNINFMQGLDLKISGSWYYVDTKQEQFTKDFQKGVNSWYTSRYSSNYFNNQLNQTYNAVLTYNDLFADVHNVNVMLGAEYYDSKVKGFQASGQGAPTDDFQDLNLTDQGEGKRKIDSWHNQNRILSFFGKVDYDYDGKYILSAVLRGDGFSRLAKDNRWGWFPGVSAGWLFNREGFMEDYSDIISFGKARISYGANGNLDTGYIGNYTVQGAYGNSTKYDGETSNLLSTLPNPALVWEKSRTFEVGVDLGFLDNKYNFNISYYNRHTTDKIANITLPSHSGISSFLSNNGELQNQGIEFELKADILKTKDWNWTVSMNGAYNKNKIISLPDNGLERNRQGAYEVYTGNKDEKKWVGGYQEGQTPGVIYAFKAKGLYRSESEIPGNLIDKTSGNNGSNGKWLYGPEAWAQLSDADKKAGFPIQPGDVIWEDVNKDGVIDNYDQVKIGSSVPKWTGGLTTTATWKGLTLTVRTDFALGYYVTDNRTPWIMGCMQGAFNTIDLVKKAYDPATGKGKYPTFTWADQLQKRNYARSTSMFIYRGDYLAFREVSLAYSLPKAWISKLRMEKLDLNVSAQNLGYITAAKNMFSPEYGADSMGGYALPRTFIFGLNVTF